MMIAPSDLPQVSAPLPWQQRAWSQLNKQLAHGQLPHALLLVGGQYTGKSQLAMALARLLLCVAPEGGLNCGACHACELSARGNHGDFRWVEPEDKSRIIKIEQIREVVRFTNRTAGFGLRKAIVLAPAESMNVNAFNALLKPLEEPAQDTYWILVCHRLYGVPATIRSRCQIVHFPNPDTDVCLGWLDKTTGSQAESQELLSLAEGLPLLAQQLHMTGSSEKLAKRRLGIQSILRGHSTLAEVGALWSEETSQAFLTQFARELERLLRSLPLERLRTNQTRAAFGLLQELNRLQRAVSAGANPSKTLLMDALMAKSRKELGSGPLGDKIWS
jgi:DNA polymerase-3 subunit delta'